MKYETKSMLKMIVGLALILIGLWLLFSGYFFSDIPIPVFRYWQSLKILLKGGVPVALAIIGLLMAWVEYDEMKQSKKLKEGK